MRINVTVIPTDPASELPEGTPVHIEVRDVSLQDAPAKVLAAADTSATTFDVVGEEPGVPVPWSATATLEVPDDIPLGADVAVWARVAASGADRTSSGDLITVQSFPLNAPALPKDVTVTVREI